MKTKSFPLLVLALGLFFANPGLRWSHCEEMAVGQVVVVNEYEDPILAKVFLAKSYEDFGVIVNVGTGNGKKERITKKSIREVIPVPDLKGDFLHPHQFAIVAATLDRLVKLIERYPQFREPLLPLGTELKFIADSGKQGLDARGVILVGAAPFEKLIRVDDQYTYFMGASRAKQLLGVVEGA